MSADLTKEDLEVVGELLSQGLQRGDAAAAVWMSPDEFEALYVAGCSPNGTTAQREFSRLVIVKENECKARWVRLAATSKSSYGPLSLLQLRFKSTWSKDAKPAPEAIPNNLIDWDAALAEMLGADDSPLHALLQKHGWAPPKAKKK